jgi:glycosyltransferase involved in cell wall biosynthesis
VKVSVVIPLYNKVRHIARAVGSVLAQTFDDFEVIVVDDGSTDRGSDAVARMRDLRVRVVGQANAGVSAARNRGVREARCDLVAFLDADDEWRPCFLETVVGLCERHPGAGMYATAYCFQKDGQIRRPEFVDCVVDPEGGLIEDYFRAALGPEPVCASAVMVPKRILNEVGGFPPGIQRGEDLHTWARIALRYPVAWSPVEGAVYHLSSDNQACASFPVSADVVVAEPIEEFLESGAELVSPRLEIEEYLALWRLRLALNLLLQGQRSLALHQLRKTQSTNRFQRRRFYIRLLAWLPSSVLQLLLTLSSLICGKRRPSGKQYPSKTSGFRRGCTMGGKWET